MVEQLIGPKTRAILATHVYGLPCEVDRLEEIARRHNLLLIYDAAHAFGCRYRGRPLASYGDISCLSFHATKVFHSVEGGAVVVNRPDSDLLKRVEYMRSFGHIADDFRWAGINAKCSELHAAMGLCNLPRVTETIAQRKEVCRRYDEVLANTAIRRIDFSNPELMHNGAYYPIVFPSEKTLLETMKRLNQVSVFPRRYFWPALNRLEFLGPRDCPCAESAADRVICLPVSPEVTPEIVELVGRHIRAVTG
jgi:dTDP-4-amino-4,6-dideoxygalactose transaminase